MESHLLQMRGLKRRGADGNRGRSCVASFTDAWIETTVCVIGLTIMSVASFTDAWIETIGAGRRQKRAIVASFTDAWIETPRFIRLPLTIESHLLQMRGLKLLSPLVFLSMICRIFYRCVD